MLASRSEINPSQEAEWLPGRWTSSLGLAGDHCRPAALIIDGSLAYDARSNCVIADEDVSVRRNEVDEPIANESIVLLVRRCGGVANDVRAGVVVFSVGQSPDKEVDLDIIGNEIRNATAGTINIRRVGGRVRVLGNMLSTSDQAAKGNDAVRLVNTGSYLMANNRIESRQPDGIGIAVFSQFAEWPMERAVIEDNEVIMSPHPGAVSGDSSAGINIRGFAYNNVVRRNTIRGRARAALSEYAFRGGLPTDNQFINNRFENFHGALADIFVGSGVVRSRIVGPGSVVGAEAIRSR